MFVPDEILAARLARDEATRAFPNNRSHAIRLLADSVRRYREYSRVQGSYGIFEREAKHAVEALEAWTPPRTAERNSGPSMAPPISRVARGRRSRDEEVGLPAPFSLAKDEPDTWSYLVGMSEAKEQLAPVSEIFLDPSVLERLEIRGAAPSVLFYGPAGTGKSSVVSGFLRELSEKIPALQVSFVTPGTIQSRWYGQSNRNLEATFDEAFRRIPCALVADDVDFFVNRGNSRAGPGVDMTSTVLRRFDRIVRDRLTVFVAWITNHPWKLDPALVSRMTFRVFVDLPTEEARIEMVRCALRPVKTAGFDWGEVGTRTKFLSGRELDQLSARLKLNLVTRKSIPTTDKEPEGVVTMDDFRREASRIRPSVTAEYLSKLESWRSNEGLETEA